MIQTLIIDLILVGIVVYGVWNEEKLVAIEDELWAITKWVVKNPRKALKNIERSIFA